MKYRKFGKLSWEVSALGFGAMRLPTEEKDYGAIREAEAGELIRYAIDHGVNYLDTAWIYHRENSEGFLGKVLSDGYRERVRIATKMPTWMIEKPEDLDRFFDAQMERLQVDQIDFYLLHALQTDWWDNMKRFHYLDWAEKKMADGAIGHLGFSFHDKFSLFKRIIDDYDNWTLAMVQYNYMDVRREAGLQGVQYAADKGLAVVVMEPLRGGQLAKEPPEDIKQILETAAPGRSAAEWGLRWLWDQEKISVVLSGMSTLEQLKQNIKTVESSEIGGLTAEEHTAVNDVRKAYESKASILCTDCRYCMPCPQGVGIPFVFNYFNMVRIYNDLQTAKAYYAFMGEDSNAANCTMCGECMEHCPQHLDIINLLKECHTLLHTEKAEEEEKR
ncbi:MAG: aldo/keto reductase [Candidatus Sabulitectum sp.]|nr:aldo/keto reductase [Candidatus Sabulitectum sp.]